MGRIICGFDIETTGLDHDKDSVTEIAWVICETGDPKPLEMQTMFIRPEDLEALEISEENFAITHISKRHLEHGVSLLEFIAVFHASLKRHGVEAIVAHNGAYFDHPFILKKLDQAGYIWREEPSAIQNILWLDTYSDVVFPKHCRWTNLIYLAAFHGFLNPFPHQALSDVQTMLAILSRYDIEEVIERARSPWLTVKAIVDYARKDEAKALRFFWERTGEADPFYPKSWVKKVRMLDFETLKAEASFELIVLQ